MTTREKKVERNLPPSVNATLQEVAAAVDSMSSSVHLLVQRFEAIDTNARSAPTHDGTESALPEEPKRVERDWQTAKMGTCECGQRAQVLPDDDGVMTCMSCFNRMYLAELRDYANQLRALLVAQLAATQHASASVAEGVMHVKALGLLTGIWCAGSEIDRWLEDILASTKAESTNSGASGNTMDGMEDELGYLASADKDTADAATSRCAVNYATSYPASSEYRFAAKPRTNRSLLPAVDAMQRRF